MKNKSIFIGIIIVILLFSIIIIGIKNNSNKEKTLSVISSDFVMDTFASYQVWGGDSKAKEYSSLVHNLDSLLDMHNDSSEIYMLNNSKGESINISDDTAEVLNNSLELCRSVDGNVDISAGALCILWDVTGEHSKIPSDEAIETALSTIDYKSIIVNQNNASILKDGLVIDLGAVAKGYACDKLFEKLKQENATSAIFSLGSSSLLYGEKPDGKPFSVAIRNPEKSIDSFLGIIKTKQAFISTSGSYERFFELDGKKYHHIFDLKTGFPVETDLISVTVICDNGIKSDFLSTQIFIEGSEGLKKHLNADDYSVIAVTSDKTIYITERIADNFTLSEDAVEYKIGYMNE